MSKTKKLYTALFFIITLITNRINTEHILKLEYGKNKEFPWQLTETFLRSMKELFNIDSFIETGTWEGNTAKNAAGIFNHVGTVELGKEIYEKAKVHLSAHKNVICYLGNSSTMLEPMIKDAKGRILFWLDGHYSGESTSTAFEKSTTPIIEELGIIKRLGITNSVILIDDIRFFDHSAKKSGISGINGYPLLEEIIPLIHDINSNYEIVILGDILLAFEKNDSIVISDVLKAYTLMRINLDLSQEELIKIERTISQAQGNELEAITTCYIFFCTSNILRGAYDSYGVAAHSALCYALTLVHKKQIEEALNILNGPINLALDPKYIAKLRERIVNNKL